MERPSEIQTAFRGFGQKENWGEKVFSPRPPLSKTFDVIESLFIAFLILTASGSPPDFFVGKKMLILFVRFLRIEAFPPFQSQTKRQDPSFSSGCHFRKTVNRDSIRGKVLEGREEGVWGRGPLSRKVPSPLPHIFPTGSSAQEPRRTGREGRSGPVPSRGCRDRRGRAAQNVPT